MNYCHDVSADKVEIIKMQTVRNASIAIIPCAMLGDSLILLVLAENLHRAGYSVTYYSDAVYDMKNWCRYFSVKPAPQPQDLDELLETHHLILLDVFAPLPRVLTPQSQEELSHKLVFLSSVVSLPRLFNVPEVKKETEELAKDDPVLRSLISSSGVLRTEKRNHMSLVDYCAEFCELRGIKNVTTQVSLEPRAGLKSGRYDDRILIFPTTEINKAYPARKFLRLAGKLAAVGKKPNFVVTPAEKEHWQALAHDYPVVSFESIDDLASYIYESALSIANDSGGGHLASLLGVPTVTIYKRKDFFEFRPGWSEGVVVRPYANLKVLGRRVWRPFLPVSRVFDACMGLLARRQEPG